MEEGLELLVTGSPEATAWPPMDYSSSPPLFEGDSYSDDDGMEKDSDFFFTSVVAKVLAGIFAVIAVLITIYQVRSNVRASEFFIPQTKCWHSTKEYCIAIVFG